MWWSGGCNGRSRFFTLGLNPKPENAVEMHPLSSEVLLQAACADTALAPVADYEAPSSARLLHSTSEEAGWINSVRLQRYDTEAVGESLSTVEGVSCTWKPKYPNTTKKRFRGQGGFKLNLGLVMSTSSPTWQLSSWRFSLNPKPENPVHMDQQSALLCSWRIQLWGPRKTDQALINPRGLGWTHWHVPPHTNSP